MYACLYVFVILGVTTDHLLISCVVLAIDYIWADEGRRNFGVFEVAALENIADLLPLKPLPTTALQNKIYETLFRFDHFNSVQTQIFHCLYNTDR